MKHFGRGFTLIELVVALAVAGILLGIAVPSFQGMIAQQRVIHVASSLHSTLAIARSEAVKRNQAVTVRPLSGESWDGGWVVANPDSPSSNNAALAHEALAGGVTITGTASQIIYRPNGRLNSSGGQAFTIESATDAAAVRCLRISLDGRASTLKGKC